MTFEKIWMAGHGRAFRVLLVAGIVAMPHLEGLSALAGVTSSTAIRYYNVSGTTKASLARQMRSNPFRGEHGAAVANTRPRYSLSVTTKKTGSTCQASSVNLKVSFTLTLPRARESAMSASTRSSWRSFVSFARRHEQQHRSIYLQCASNFVAKAQKLTASSCGAVQRKARSLLKAEERACDRRHAAFDRRERRRLRGLSLLRGS